MPTFVEYTDYSLLLELLCRKTSGHLLAALLDEKKLNIQKIRVTSVDELAQNLDEAGDLWCLESQERKLKVVDLGVLEISEVLLKVIADKENIILTRIENELNIDDKKILKKVGIEVLSLKKVDTEIVTSIYSQYAKVLALDITTTQIAKLAQQTNNYFEIIDNLDFIVLSGETKTAFESLIVEQDLELYKRTFSVNNLAREAKIWYKAVSDEGELQLALSLIFTKLSKQNSPIAKEVQKSLIELDKRIKNNSKAKSLTWFRAWLAQVGGLQV